MGEFELDEKLFWSAPGTREKRAWRSRKNAGIWAAKKKLGSSCDGGSELFERRADAFYSRENPGRLDPPQDGQNACDDLILNGCKHLTAEFSIMRMNLCAGNPTSTALNASGVTPNNALQSSMV